MEEKWILCCTASRKIKCKFTMNIFNFYINLLGKFCSSCIVVNYIDGLNAKILMVKNQMHAKQGPYTAIVAFESVYGTNCLSSGPLLLQLQCVWHVKYTLNDYCLIYSRMGLLLLEDVVDIVECVHLTN